MNGWPQTALELLREQRRWTPEAVERDELGWDDRAGTVLIPIRDATGDKLGELRYLPDPARRNGRSKMQAPAGVPRQLFPPPETIADDEAADRLLLLTEGEPDQVAALSAGFAAVGVPGVQGWRPDYPARFAGRRWTVCVCFDCDQEGRAKGAEVAASLAAAGVDVRLVGLDPARDDGCDLTDFLRERGPDALRELLEQTPAYVPLASAGMFVDPSVTFAEFIARRDDTNRAPLIAADQGTLLPPGGFAILAATVGHGKTTSAVELVLHAVAGRDWLELSFPRPLNVLVIENEGPREAFREKLDARLATWPHGGAPRIWDEQAEWGAIRISDPTTRERLRVIIETHRIDLIVADSLTRFGVRGNGTPEETREFVEWLTELGLGRDVAFLLLHHPRTRPEHGESELEQLAGAWQPHADLVLRLVRLEGGRARLSFPKTRWAKGQRPPCILTFDAITESFSYVGVDEPEHRDLAAELSELMVDGDWWTVTALRKPKEQGGVGAAPEAVKQALQDERFESVNGEKIGKRKDSTHYRLAEPSRPPGDGRDAMTLLPEEGEASPSPPRERARGGDASLGADSPREDDPTPDEVERLANVAREAQQELDS